MKLSLYEILKLKILTGNFNLSNYFKNNAILEEKM
jgi:hypothetical protein